MAEERRDSLGIIPTGATPVAVDPPAWFVTEMYDGIVGLCRHPLLHRPKASTEPQYNEQYTMAVAFAEAAWPGRRWDEGSDKSRLQAAFGLLAQGHRLSGSHLASYFPGVHDLLDALPRRRDAEPEKFLSVDKEKARAFMRKIREQIK